MFDLLAAPPPPLLQSTPSVFDLLHQTPAASSVPLTASDSPFDLLFVSDDGVCQCGCRKPVCSCSAIARCANPQLANLNRKPIVRMKSASWCGVCRTAKQEIGEAKDCPFELVVDPNENAQTVLPEFTWQAGGKWWTPIDPATGQPRPGYFGVKDLVAHWESTRPAHQPEGASPRFGSTTTAASAVRLSDQVAARVEELARAKIRSPPAFGQPGDSAKKSLPLKNAGDMTSGDASAERSAGKFGTSTRPATPSRS